MIRKNKFSIGYYIVLNSLPVTKKETPILIIDLTLYRGLKTKNNKCKDILDELICRPSSIVVQKLSKKQTKR